MLRALEVRRCVSATFKTHNLWRHENTVSFFAAAVSVIWIEMFSFTYRRFIALKTYGIKR